MESNTKMNQIFGFGISTVMLRYFGDVLSAATIMSAACKKSRKTWFDYLKIFTEILQPSDKLRSRLSDKRFFDNMSDETLDKLVRKPISYFRFSIDISTGGGISSNIYINFVTYLEHLHLMSLEVPTEQRFLYKINKHCEIKIDANKNLKAYMKIYDYLERIGVDDHILNVKFTRCEDDYDEPVYCPYFHLAKVTIKNQEDAQWAKRYFVEYFTSQNDPELPFYRKVDVFLWDVTIKKCLETFLEHWKTKLDTLVINYNTLCEIMEDKGINSTVDTHKISIFSKTLWNSLRCIRLVGINSSSTESLKNVLKYINTQFTTDGEGYYKSDIKFDSISLGVKDTVNNSKLSSKLLKLLNEIRWDWYAIEIDFDSIFKIKEAAPYNANDTYLEIFNSEIPSKAEVIDSVSSKKTCNYWRQIMKVEKLMIYGISKIKQNSNKTIDFISTKGLKLTGITNLSLDDLKFNQSLLDPDMERIVMEEKQLIQSLNSADIQKCSFSHQNEFNVKLLPKDTQSLFTDPKLYAFLLSKD